MVQFNLKRRFFLQQRPLARLRGFTLIEVLISVLISGLIVSGLMYLAVQLLKVDREETVLNEAQQDTRRALDYISRELREAVFVYPTQGDLDAVAAELSDLPAGTPVVAFWRTDPVPPSEINALSDCSAFSGDDAENCRVLRLRQNVYTLVVYLLQDNTSADIWEGESRIVRYELTQYSEISSSNLTERAGYVDPAPNNFGDWTANGGTTNGTWAVLADSIDDPLDDTTAGTLPECDTTNRYARIPDNSDAGASDPEKTSYSFFTCVRDPVLTAAERAQLGTTLSDDDAAQTNQDMVVYLRGDASDEQPTGGLTFFSEDSRLPTLEARILVRGLLDKRPE